METINCGMIGFVVPLKLYPKGYQCNPNEPLPFLSIGNQKNYITIYHMGLYLDKNLMGWFINEYKKIFNKKPNIGKSCIRFKKIDEIPFELIGELTQKISVEEWINIYENTLRANRKNRS